MFEFSLSVQLSWGNNNKYWIFPINSDKYLQLTFGVVISNENWESCGIKRNGLTFYKKIFSYLYHFFWWNDNQSALNCSLDMATCIISYLVYRKCIFPNLINLLFPIISIYNDFALPFQSFVCLDCMRDVMGIN